MTAWGLFWGFVLASVFGTLGLLVGCVFASKRVYEAQEDARASRQKLAAYKAQVENPPAPFEFDRSN